MAMGGVPAELHTRKAEAAGEAQTAATNLVTN